MSKQRPLRVGYLVKRYPRYSETFIVREILAHEKAGMEVEIFSLRPPNDGHFQELIARVKGRVNPLYFPSEGLLPETLASAMLPASHFWETLKRVALDAPEIWFNLEELKDARAPEVYQALSLAHEIRQKGIDHLHATFASDAATVARLASKLTGVSYSVTARAKDIFHDSAQREDLIRKFQDASGVITISDYHLQYLVDHFGLSRDHITRVYNGLDLTEFPYSSPFDRAPMILSVGRLVEKKGFGDLINACGILRDRGLRFGCRIVGAGKLRAELEQQVHRLDLVDQVRLVGPMPQSGVIEEMRRAAVMALPCIVGADGDRDGLPNVIQESLALGTPVVTTDVTGIPEVVRDEDTGLQVPQRDAVALARAIERLLLDPSLRVRLAEGARRMMETDFDIDRNAARRRAVFQAGREAASMCAGGVR